MINIDLHHQIDVKLTHKSIKKNIHKKNPCACNHYEILVTDKCKNVPNVFCGQCTTVLHLVSELRIPFNDTKGLLLYYFLLTEILQKKLRFYTLILLSNVALWWAPQYVSLP